MKYPTYWVSWLSQFQLGHSSVVEPTVRQLDNHSKEKYMTNPLTVWQCDTCGDDITEPVKALVTWRNEGRRAYDFRIVHKNMDGRRCDPGAERGFQQSTNLSSFLGIEGLTYAL